MRQALKRKHPLPLQTHLHPTDMMRLNIMIRRNIVGSLSGDDHDMMDGRKKNRDALSKPWPTRVLLATPQNR
jgi:hypothetical protein